MNVAADKVTFYNYVDSNVVAECLKNMLDDILCARLLLKKSAFSFVDAANCTVSCDRPIMLKIVLSELDQNVVVGIELLWQKLETICLHTYKNMLMRWVMNLRES